MFIVFSTGAYRQGFHLEGPATEALPPLTAALLQCSIDLTAHYQSLRQASEETEKAERKAGKVKAADETKRERMQAQAFCTGPVGVVLYDDADEDGAPIGEPRDLMSFPGGLGRLAHEGAVALAALFTQAGGSAWQKAGGFEEADCDLLRACAGFPAGVTFLLPDEQEEASEGSEEADEEPEEEAEEEEDLPPPPRLAGKPRAGSSAPAARSASPKSAPAPKASPAPRRAASR